MVVAVVAAVMAATVAAAVEVDSVVVAVGKHFIFH